MNVKVRYFAVLREVRGVEEELVAFDPGETVGALYERLFPASAEGRLPVAFAINHAYVSPQTLLEEGAAVAFIPPLGGG